MTTAKQDLKRVDRPSLDLQGLFGPPPLVEGEDPAAYDALSAHIRNAVEPRDVLEEIWVRDIVDIFWETLRLRRLKAKLLQSSAMSGVMRILSSLFEPDRAREMARRWASGKSDARELVRSHLERHGLDQEAIHAQTLGALLDQYGKIDAMIIQTEARRNAVLREVDRHRDAVAQRLRAATTEIEVAHFEVIASDGGAQ